LDSTCDADTAIIYDYDNDSNCKIEGYIGLEEWKSEEAVFQALNERHIMTNVISHENLKCTEDLEKYKVIFYVNAQLLDEKDVTGLKSYVEQGGTIVFGPRSG